jgi:hypothetical protein
MSTSDSQTGRSAYLSSWRPIKSGSSASTVPMPWSCLYEAVAAAQERVIGADHPDTLITRHGLAAAYEAAGRTADALTEYERVAARFEAVMGPEQTLTKRARADLERARRSLQRR